MPSRDENWKAKLAKMKARVGFKAAIRVATISSRWEGQKGKHKRAANTDGDDEDDENNAEATLEEVVV